MSQSVSAPFGAITIFRAISSIEVALVALRKTLRAPAARRGEMRHLPKAAPRDEIETALRALASHRDTLAL